MKLALKVKIYLFIFIVASFFLMPAANAADYDNFEQSLYIWRLINDVRQNPVKSLTALGIDVDELRAHLGEESFLLDRKLPPLAFDPGLYESADQYNKDMINNGVWDNNTPSDGVSSLEVRISSEGYNAVKSGESMGVLSFDTYRDAFDSAKVIFVNMIKDELFADAPRNYRIFSDIFTEMGVSMQAGNLSIDNSALKRAYVVVMDFGFPVEKRSYVIGNTVKLTSNTGIFDLENAVGGVPIVFKDIFKDIKQSGVSTSALGAFEFLKDASSSGYMILKALNQDGSVNSLKIFQVDDENKLYDLTIHNSNF